METNCRNAGLGKYWYNNNICRAAKSHAFRVRLAHVHAFLAAFSFDLLFFFSLIFSILAKSHAFASWKVGRTAFVSMVTLCYCYINALKCTLGLLIMYLNKTWKLVFEFYIQFVCPMGSMFLVHASFCLSDVSFPVFGLSGYSFWSG